MLKQIFTELSHHYTHNPQLVEKLWQEIEAKYTDTGRYYHTLTHLQHLYEQLEPRQQQIRRWHVMLFSLFYHDLVYNTLKQNNEEKSAAAATQRLTELAVPAELVAACARQIVATKSHQVSADEDTNLFTDVDLSVLGQEWEVYKSYTENIRKEYVYYPDLLYKPGRKKVLTHFLQMQRIFKTDAFYGQYEEQARQNLAAELSLL